MEQTIAKQQQDFIPVKQQVSDILVEVSWGRISEDYFGKSRSWLSKKMNGKDFNGNSVGDFTSEEKETLRGALVDLAERIKKVAYEIK